MMLLVRNNSNQKEMELCFLSDKSKKILSTQNSISSSYIFQKQIRNKDFSQTKNERTNDKKSNTKRNVKGSSSDRRNMLPNRTEVYTKKGALETQ